MRQPDPGSHRVVQSEHHADGVSESACRGWFVAIVRQRARCGGRTGANLMYAILSSRISRPCCEIEPADQRILDSVTCPFVRRPFRSTTTSTCTRFVSAAAPWRPAECSSMKAWAAMKSTCESDTASARSSKPATDKDRCSQSGAPSGFATTRVPFRRPMSHCRQPPCAPPELEIVTSNSADAARLAPGKRAIRIHVEWPGFDGTIVARAKQDE